MSKCKVTIEVAVTYEYEIDLEKDPWASFPTVKEALEYDAGLAHEDPVLWMEQMEEQRAPHIKTRARVHGTNKYDVLLEDKEHNCAEAAD